MLRHIKPWLCLKNKLTFYNATYFSQIRQELQRAKDILQHAQETNQSINMMINHLLEPGEGIVKKRLKIRKDGEPNTISQQQSQHEQEEQLKKGGGRKAPVPPGSGMLDTFLPVLQSVIRADEFPELVSTHAQSTNAEIPGS